MVEQVDDQITYEIEWDRRTLDGMHPVYRKRCERDGLTPETMWLGEEDIEPDEGTPVPIEQPTEIRTPPLSDKDYTGSWGQIDAWGYSQKDSQKFIGNGLDGKAPLEHRLVLSQVPLAHAVEPTEEVPNMRP